MNQQFRVSDILRGLAMNTPIGPNFASPDGGRQAQTGLALWKRMLWEQKHRLTIVDWNGLHLDGLVSARTATGRVFQVDHLHLPHLQSSNGAGPGISNSKEGLGSAGPLRLLESLVKLAGSRGAERLFLRLPSGSPALRLAQQTGFFPHFQEIQWEGEAPEPSLDSQRTSSLFSVRQSEDEHRLFQLFSACTPAPVRTAVGVTLEQWQDWQSLWPRQRQEWTASAEGRIRGWVALSRNNNAVEARLMAQPDWPEMTNRLIMLATESPGPHRWLVPDYQAQVSERLQTMGWRETTRYNMLINRVAVPVESPGMAPVEA